RIEVAVGADAGERMGDPGAAEARLRLQHDEARPLVLMRQVPGRADAGNAGADDQHVEVLPFRGGRTGQGRGVVHGACFRLRRVCPWRTGANKASAAGTAVSSGVAPFACFRLGWDWAGPADRWPTPNDAGCRWTLAEGRSSPAPWTAPPPSPAPQRKPTSPS